ncbi:hypothetical protein ACFQ7J_06920 [Streptomyces sp. NPDC056501]|uniref:hypothetical protein n=1 Tax=Streptomyces sp. NPDC056501 TaxID=3345841 RepID=UPI0036A89D19
MSGSESGRTVGRMVRVSVLTLLLEGTLAVAARTVFADPADDRAGFLVFFTHPTLATIWLLGLVAAAVFLVLPVVWLSEELERRFRGRADAWIPVVAAAAATVPVLPRALSAGSGPADSAGAWLTTVAVLSVAALVTRRAGGGRGLRRNTPAPTS